MIARIAQQPDSLQTNAPSTGSIIATRCQILAVSENRRTNEKPASAMATREAPNRKIFRSRQIDGTGLFICNLCAEYCRTHTTLDVSLIWRKNAASDLDSLRLYRP